MPTDCGRIHRLLKLLTWIQGGKGWNTKRLALEWAITERNIYRNLKIFTGAGMPWDFDKESDAYQVRRAFLCRRLI